MTTDRGMRRGLTLVEVLVVLAVGFVMLALLLPAIRAAQLFQNRRAICTNNLKQIGLAIHNYHSANGSLPMSVVAGGKGHGIGHSGFIGEQGAVVQTADDRLDARALQRIALFFAADESTHAMPVTNEPRRNRSADKTARAGHKNIHSLLH